MNVRILFSLKTLILAGNYPLESANLFHELLLQLKEDPTVVVKVPVMFVHAAGTGTSFDGEK